MSVPRPHREVSSTCVVVKTSVVRGAALIYSIVVYQVNDNLLSLSEPGEPNPAKPRLRDANNRTYSACTRFEERLGKNSRRERTLSVPYHERTGSVPREYLTAPRPYHDHTATEPRPYRDRTATVPRPHRKSTCGSVR